MFVRVSICMFSGQFGLQITSCKVLCQLPTPAKELARNTLATVAQASAEIEAYSALPR